MRTLLHTVFLSLLGVQSYAACLPPAEPFLSCTLRNGAKTLDVCIANDTLSYTYGPKSGPAELALTQSARDVDYEPWPGIGRTIWENGVALGRGQDPTLRKTF
jgi:hypothetical protein